MSTGLSITFIGFNTLGFQSLFWIFSQFYWVFSLFCWVFSHYFGFSVTILGQHHWFSVIFVKVKSLTFQFTHDVVEKEPICLFVFQIYTCTFVISIEIFFNKTRNQ